MKLYILREDKTLTDPSIFKVNAKHLSLTGTHVFLASQNWESAFIELCEDIPSGFLSSIGKITKNITLDIPEKQTKKILDLLLEYYPKLKGKLRRVFQEGGDLRCIVSNVEEAENN